MIMCKVKLIRKTGLNKHIRTDTNDIVWKVFDLFAGLIEYPQFIQDDAVSETSILHSGQLINDILDLF